MKRNSFTVLFALILCCTVLVTEGRSTQLLRIDGEQDPTELISLDENDEQNEDTEEYRFLSGAGTGASTASAINNLITQQQQRLENLRPQGGSATSTAGANVIYVNAGATASSGTTSTTSGNNGVAGLLLPQVIGAALSGGRRRAPGRRRRRRPANNRNRNQNRNRSRRRPQVYLVRP